MKNLVIAEFINGDFRSSGAEVVAAAKALGGETIVLAIGSGLSGAGDVLGGWGADKVLTCDQAALKNYSSSAYAKVAVTAIEKENVQNVLLLANAAGKDLAPRIASRLGTSVLSDCTALANEGGAPTAVRPIFAGKIESKVRLTSERQVISIRPNTFPASSGAGTAPVESLEVALEPVDLLSTVRETLVEAGTKIELTEAKIVVAGGRGLGSKENFGLIDDLASAIGAAVGASRAVVDAGWRPHSEQVGQTGKVVSPNLYFAIGISGAIQHIAGMRSSKCIVAINKDPEAPIFKISDYGIVGDLNTIVPALKEELLKIKAS